MANKISPEPPLFSFLSLHTPDPFNIVFHAPDIGERLRLEFYRSGEIKVVIAPDVTIDAASRLFLEGLASISGKFKFLDEA